MRSVQTWFVLTCSVVLFTTPACLADDSPPSQQAKIEIEQVAAPVVTPASRMADFYRRHFLAYYESFSEKAPAWDTQARAFIDGLSSYLAYNESPATPRPPGSPSLDALSIQRDALLEIGIDDPLIVYLSAMMNPKRHNDWKQEDDLLEEKAKQIARDAGQFNRVLPMFLATERLLAKRELDNGVSSSSYIRKARVRLVNDYAGLFKADSNLQQADHQPLAELFVWLVDGLNREEAQTIIAATRDTADSHRWLGLMLRGFVEYEHAWEIRGGGWASTVGEDKWARFHQHVDQAGDRFRAAWKLDPTRSLAPCWMISVSMCQGDDGEMQWFDRAVAADPNDPEPYAKLGWASRSRWGGNDKAMLRVAKTALDQGNFQTAVPTHFMLGLYSINSDYGRQWLRANGSDIWPDIQRYIEGRAAHPSAGHSADWAYSEGFWLAYMTGHPEAMRHYADQLEQDSSRFVAGHRYGIDSRWFPGQWSARSEPAARAAIESARPLAMQGNIQEAIATLEAALPGAESNLTQTHLKDRIRILHWQNDFEGNDWVELLEHGLEGWALTRGQFSELGPERGVLAKFRPQQRGAGMRMICGFNPGPQYEAELTLVLPPAFRGFTWGGVGFMLAPTVGVGSRYERLVTVRRGGHSLVWLQDPNHPDNKNRNFGSKDNEALTDVTLRMQRWNNSIRLWVNNELVIDQYTFFDQWPSTDSFAVAAYHGDIDLDYELRRVRIKKLDHSPFGDEPALAPRELDVEEQPTDASTPAEPDRDPQRRRPPFGR